MRILHTFFTYVFRDIYLIIHQFVFLRFAFANYIWKYLNFWLAVFCDCREFLPNPDLFEEILCSEKMTGEANIFIPNWGFTSRLHCTTPFTVFWDLWEPPGCVCWSLMLVPGDCESVFPWALQGLPEVTQARSRLHPWQVVFLKEFSRKFSSMEQIRNRLHY